MKSLMYVVVCLYLPYQLSAYSLKPDSLHSTKASLTTLHGLVARHSYIPAKALIYARQAIELAEAINDKPGLAKSYSLAGNMCILASRHNEALEHFLKSLELRYQLGNAKQIALSLDNLGLVYEQMGEAKKALRYYKAALKMNQKSRDQFAITSNLSNIASVYRKQNNYLEAVAYYKQSLKESKRMDSKTATTICLNNITITQIYSRKQTLLQW